MAESADALDSGSSGSNTVCVQVTLSAPSKNPLTTSVEGFSFYFQNWKKHREKCWYDTCTTLVPKNLPPRAPSEWDKINLFPFHTPMSAFCIVAQKFIRKFVQIKNPTSEPPLRSGITYLSLLFFNCSRTSISFLGTGTPILPAFSMRLMHSLHM